MSDKSGPPSKSRERRQTDHLGIVIKIDAMREGGNKFVRQIVWGEDCIQSAKHEKFLTSRSSYAICTFLSIIHQCTKKQNNYC